MFLDESVKVNKTVIFPTGLSTHTIKMGISDYIKVEKPIIGKFIRNKWEISKVVEKALLPLIGVCFLVDYFNNDSLVRTIKCQTEAFLWPMGVFAMK